MIIENYQKYIRTDEPGSHKIAVQWLEKATENWKKVVQITEVVYEPMPLMHYTRSEENTYFHWSKLEQEVIEELNWLKNLANE